MSVDGSDFLNLAIRLSGGSSEAEWRSAVSRAYYGAFHLAREFVAACRVSLPQTADGAKLVDVLEEFGPLVEATTADDDRDVHHPGEFQLNEQERQVLDAIDVEPTTIDQIVTASRLTVHRVLSTISVLEMRRLIRRVSGDSVMRV